MLRSVSLAAVAAFLLATPLSAAEPFASPTLKVLDGLELWLEAAAQPAARTQAGLPPVGDGQLLSVLFDSSGRGRHLVQRRREAQPQLQLATYETRTLAAVRFDGLDDVLETVGQSLELRDFTVFVVAAPKTNPGDFRGLFAGNALARNDYTSGFALDLGPGPTGDFSVLNVEGRGFTGARDLKSSTHPLGGFHLLRVRARGDEVRLAVDGQEEEARPRGADPVSFDQLSLGSRFLSNDPLPARDHSFFPGEIAELLLYGRALTDDEIRHVEGDLSARHAPLQSGPVFDGPPPPDVQVFVPGFRVDTLPIQTSHINDAQFDAEGRLWVLHYDGRVGILTDSDGDGLEDFEHLFWTNPPLLMPMSMILTDKGVIVAAKERLVRIRDLDGDGLGDSDETLVTGWEPSRNYSGGVDSIGLTRGPDGSLYFGLGTADYSNAFLIDPQTGQAGYRLDGERGTIQKVSPDFKTRETVCTGIRFPVGMAFSENGDLFVTEQEGATWLPNGNPFDELLHIQPGRHYGFPPRHPKHLPNVIDEPSVFEYAPQHQSTCGLVFNIPAGNGKSFGPPGWRGQAFVCGYSRGKIWRTRLLSTDAGYVARTTLFASLRKLTLDCALAPDGSLLVVTHSGGPDWGSGPSGQGTLYRIRYVDEAEPQPTFTWLASPTEVHVAFDKPLSTAQLEHIAHGVRIEYGPAVAAGDRFEELRPGYEVVQRQLKSARQSLAVHGVQVTPDLRTVMVMTDRHPVAGPYALTLPWTPRSEASADTDSTTAAIDLQYSTAGVEATWTPKDQSEEIRIWLPHISLNAARAFTAGSAEHDRFWAKFNEPGTLTLSTQVDLANLLRPVVQPGSTLEASLPAEQPNLLLRSTAEDFRVDAAAGRQPFRFRDDRGQVIKLAFETGVSTAQPLHIELKNTENVRPRLSAAFTTAEDRRERAIPLHRFQLPWVTASDAGPLAWTPAEIIHQGSWERGRKVFEGDRAQCSRCHTVHDRGGRIGPNLSNLAHRDLGSVLRDVTQPNFAINPDFVSYAVQLTDGRVLNGTLRTDGDELVVGDTKGVETRIAKSDVETFSPQKVSIMPEGVTKTLSAQEMSDLMKFLLSPRPVMPPDLSGAPRSRTRAEVDEILAGSEPSDSTKPLKIVLVAGPKDHGPGEHDYPAFQKAWSTLLSDAPNVAVETAWEFPAPAQLESANVLVFYQRGSWDDDRQAAIDAFLARGGGLVYLHWAIEAGPKAGQFASIVGLAGNAELTKYRHGPLDLVFDRQPHPITRNFTQAHFHDESYWALVGSAQSLKSLATAVEEGEPRPLFWVREQPSSAGGPEGRIFVSILGHYSWTFDDPLYRTLLLRGLCWAAHEPVDRLNDLVTTGVTLAE